MYWGIFSAKTSIRVTCCLTWIGKFDDLVFLCTRELNTFGGFHLQQGEEIRKEAHYVQLDGTESKFLFH